MQVNGQRVELEEVERTIAADASVVGVAVVLHERQLVACVCPAEVSADRLRKRCIERLPLYMVPHRVVPMETLPQTSSGKLDRQALLRLLRAAATTAPPQAGEEVSQAAQIMATVWKELLGLATLPGPTASFFELGGSSVCLLYTSPSPRDRG